MQARSERLDSLPCYIPPWVNALESNHLARMELGRTARMDITQPDAFVSVSQVVLGKLDGFAYSGLGDTRIDVHHVCKHRGANVIYHT